MRHSFPIEFLIALLLAAGCGGAGNGGPAVQDTVTAAETHAGDADTLADSGLPGDTGSPDLLPADAAHPPADVPHTDFAPEGPPTDIPDAMDTEEPPPENPWPVPPLTEEPAPTCQAAIDDPSYFQFLDNLCNEKVWPTNQDRDRMCPVSDDSPFMTLQDGTVVEYKPASAPVEWDIDALDGLLPPGMRMAVILVKRVDGVPHYRYVSNGTHNISQQPWSTTKFLAAANAAANMRIESGYEVGLTANAGGHSIGDLVTSMCLYDNNPYTSNGLAKWFHDIGGRQRANDLIHELWLERPGTETFGGNYGEASPPIGYTFTEPGGATLAVTPDTSSGFANHLSLHTLAESLKRLVLHREEPDQRLPGVQSQDLQVLLFGAKTSTKYGKWGGMSRDTAIYLQAGHDMDYIEARSQGQWTIFSKLGLGSQGQFIHVGYACWPVFDQGKVVPNWGREFVIAAHLDQGGENWDARDRLMALAYRKVILRIVDGRL